jgi:zinc/manganese transport system permease protein
MSNMISTLGQNAFSWNLISDFKDIFSYSFMVNAILESGIISVVSGVIGYFVIIRKSAFAAHSLGHIGFAGATGAVVLGINPIWGLLTFCVLSGIGIGFGGSKMSERDATIGIVLAFSLGLGVLFLSLYTGYATEAYALLFGDVLGVSTTDLFISATSGITLLLLLWWIYRPMLFSSIDEEMAEAKGIPYKLLSVLFMILVGVNVAIAVQSIGILLIFSLLVTPAAAAVNLSLNPKFAIAISVLLSLFICYLWYLKKLRVLLDSISSFDLK